MVVLVVVLLALWLILAVLGIAVHGLLWLAIIGIILFIGTAIITGVRRSAGKRKA